jgi:hypothetical protein
MMIEDWEQRNGKELVMVEVGLKKMELGFVVRLEA